MPFNYNVFGAVTGGIGLLLGAVPMFLCFAMFRPKHLRESLDNVLSRSDQALARIQEAGISLDDFPGGIEAVQERLDAFHQEGTDINIQVDTLVTFMSELKAVWHGLSLKLWRLKRKVQLFLAQVAHAEAGGRRRQGQSLPRAPALQAAEGHSSTAETAASPSLTRSVDPNPSVPANGLRLRPVVASSTPSAYTDLFQPDKIQATDSSVRASQGDALHRGPPTLQQQPEHVKFVAPSTLGHFTCPKCNWGGFIRAKELQRHLGAGCPAHR